MVARATPGDQVRRPAAQLGDGPALLALIGVAAQRGIVGKHQAHGPRVEAAGPIRRAQRSAKGADGAAQHAGLGAPRDQARPDHAGMDQPPLLGFVGRVQPRGIDAQ